MTNSWPKYTANYWQYIFDELIKVPNFSLTPIEPHSDITGGPKTISGRDFIVLIEKACSFAKVLNWKCYGTVTP